MKKPLVLIIRDGWGISDATSGNAITPENTPYFEEILAKYPWAKMGCSGEAVGLPDGQMGNSEVGHLNIGAGRIVYQDFTRINKAIKDGSMFENEIFNKAIDNAISKDGALHLMGLLSDGGVHSHVDHALALVKMAKDKGLEKIYIHCFLDGRDTPPQSGVEYMADLENKLKALNAGKIVSVMGRYYAMDRDNRWERVEQAYEAMVDRKGDAFDDAVTAVETSYKNGKNDEFMLPAVIGGTDDYAVTDADSLIFFNFRGDRAREITRCFIDQDFAGFTRKNAVFPYFVCMAEYDETFAADIAFPPIALDNILTQVLAREGKKQLRIAETEKYAHVTFFFSGGVEKMVEHEERSLVDSPKVATYDLQPEMSAYEVTDKLVEKIKADTYDVIIVNYANADMVGHTGVFEAAVKAIKVVDECVDKVVKEVLAKDGCALITADHGNSEKMVDENGKIFTAHTTGDVHFVAVSNEYTKENTKVEEGVLADIAPTMLKLLDIPQPAEMTGTSLIKPLS